MEKNHFFAKSVCVWLPFAAVTTMLCGLSYLLVQQDIRISANYPQSQFAEDGTLLSQPVNVAASLAPFTSLFDANGRLIRSNAVLEGTTPVPPPGVFDYARANGEDRFTWEPANGIRIAAVLAYHPGGTSVGTTSGSGIDTGAADFVLSGRSLRDVEMLEDKLTADAFLVWLAALLVLYVLSAFVVMAFLPHRSTKGQNASPENVPKIQP